MSLIDAFLFACRSEFGSQAPVPFIYGGLALLVSFFLLGLLWGKLWNRRWNLSPGLIMINVCWAVLLGLAVFALSSANRTANWIEGLRINLVPQVSSSGPLNREILRDAWNILQPLGGQNELTSPTEGGNELRLNNSDEAQSLAKTAATDVKRRLLSEGPFAYGATVYARDPSVVAEEVRNSVPVPAYPVIVGPSNAWSKAAVEAQTNAALESAGKTLTEPLESLRTALTVAVIVLALLQFLLTALAACADIKANPHVR